MVPSYTKWGFCLSPTNQVVISDGNPKLPDQFQAVDGLQLQPIRDENFSDVIELDQSVWPIKRSRVLKLFFNSPSTRLVKGAYINGKLVGTIMVRNGKGHVRISAFYADSIDIARSMLYEIISNDIPEGIQLVAMYSKETFQICKELYEEFGMTGLTFKDEFMYTKKALEINWKRVFAIFEHYAFPV